MKTHIRCAALFVILASSVTFSQVSTGTPPLGSFGGGPFDVVNLGNLNVHFAVPVFNRAGRGMSFRYNLSYDSSVWTPVTSSGVTQWQPASNWGWRGDTEVATGYYTNTITQRTWCNSGTETIASNWVYHDKFGVAHAFAGSAVMYRYGRDFDCGGEGIYPFTATATDGSGYTLTTSSRSIEAGGFTSRSGAILSVPYNTGNGAGTVTDANGNEITVNTSGQFFDTLSSTVPVLTVSAPSPPASATFSYTAPSGATASYTMNYTQYTVETKFGISGVTEYGPLANSLVSSIQLPDGTEYQFTYEKTPGSCTPLSGTYSGYCVTGRIASVTLATGGTISYAYSGGPDSTGIYSDGSTAGITRTLTATTTAPAETWTYARTLVSGTPGPGSKWTTTVTDPGSNHTVMSFAEDAAVTAQNGNTYTTATYNFYETQRQAYQGSVSSNNCSATVTTNCLLLTTTRCYNANYASCSTATVTSPISQTDAYAQPAGGATRLSEVLLNTYGLVTDDKEYDYGAVTGSAPGTTHLIRETVTAYASLGNGIVNKPSGITVYDWTSGSKVEIANSSYGYDQTAVTTTTGTPQHVSVTGSRGNLTTATTYTSGTATLSQTKTYYDTGTLNVSTGVNGAQTTYIYSSATNPYNSSFTASCGNSFATTIDEPLSLTRSMQWNCEGGIPEQVTDENGNPLSSSYTDPYFWRPASTTDQMSNVTDLTYHGQTVVETSLQNFNSGHSAADMRVTVDGFNRTIFSQRLQAPGGTEYDTSEIDYNAVGEVSATRMPYAATASPTSEDTSAPETTTTYDALGRVLTTQDADGGYVSNQYVNNDVLQTSSGTPSGTQAFKKQYEYDGLGRLTSVCEISSTLSGVGTCSQTTTQTGYWTKYTYDALGHLLTVTQNAQAASGSQQKRTYTYDWLGRMLTESNPETGNAGTNGTVTYTYDVACATTPASPGDLTGKLDAAGNTTCYYYDALHRLNGGGYNNVCRRLHYDKSVTPPSGITVVNSNTRLIEASTDNCGSTQYTDEWFSYDKDGRLTDVYESTPHSGGYYHSTSGYWPTGVVNTLSLLNSSGTALFPTQTYGLDGEGRPNAVSAASGTNPVTGVTYSSSSTSNPLGALTNVTFGNADSDGFSYDPNTGRMGKYTYTVNSHTDVGTLTWSANGTLTKLVINDAIPGTVDSQTCTYGYDDLRRVSSVGCGVLWSQNFTYDAFGNISKTVPSGDSGTTFLPTYWTSPPTNQFSALPGVTVSYDKNGKLLTDNLNTYTWDPNWGTMQTVTPTGSSTVTSTYDAMGRMVENNAGGSYYEFVYGPGGTKLAKCSGQTLVKAFIALPSGAKAIYTPTGLTYFRHSDWLGSSRLTSTAATPTSMYSSSAYAPFGEQYANAGSADASFTGKDQDTVSNLYDFPARRLSPSQGRWISPDPAGLAAVALMRPQTWNRYAYAENNPLSYIDEDGTSDGSGDDDDGGGGGGDDDDDDSAGGGGGGDNGGNDFCAANPDDADCMQMDESGPSPVPANEACVTGALEEVLAAGETGGQPNDGYGTNVMGTVAQSPQFPQYVGQSNVQIPMNQLAGLTSNPQLYVQYPQGLSSAFGRYQITNQTGQAFGCTDWTPSGQDDCAASMLNYYDAVQPAMQGNLEQALWNMSAWASMPNSPLPGGHMSMDQAFAIYSNAMTYLPECQTSSGVSMSPPQPGG